MEIMLVMMLTLIFPNGEIKDIRMQSLGVPNMKTCLVALENFPVENIEAEDGTYITTYFVCEESL